MYSKIKIFHHPVHPILVGYPIAFYTAALAGFIIYPLCGNFFWFKLGWWSNAAGVAMALLAAVPGFIDWLFIPSEKKAKSVGMQHMLYNVTALMIFGVNLGLQYKKLKEETPNATSAILLCSAGLIVTTIASYLGASLMQQHHVGIDLTEEQQKLEP